MRKKALRARNDQLRWELSRAQQLAATQMKQVNEHRMQLAILKVEMEMQSVGANNVVRDEAASATDPRCPTCGLPTFISAGGEPVVKTCPECAEEVQVAARRCRYCDYRFDAADRRRIENESKEPAANGGAPVARLGTAAGT